MVAVRANTVAGVLDAALSTSQTTMESAGLADLPAISAPDYARVTIFRRDVATRQITASEIVHVTAHVGGSMVATILRGQEGTTAQTWLLGEGWDHATTAAELDNLEPLQLVSGINPNGWTAATPGTTFPAGTLRFQVTSAAGWPVNGMMTVSRIEVASGIYQTLEQANNTLLLRRAWNNTAGTWRAWETVASQAHVTAALVPILADVAANKALAEAINARGHALGAPTIYEGARKPDAGSVGSTDSGAVYHRLGSWGRAGNRIVNPLGGNDRKLVVDVGQAWGELTALVDLAAAGNFGVSFRGTADDQQNQLAVSLMEAGAVQLRRALGAERSTLDSTSIPLQPGLHTLSVWSDDDLVLVRVDGVEQLRVTLDPADVAEFDGFGWGLYCHQDVASACLGWAWQPKAGLAAAWQGTESTAGTSGGGSTADGPAFTYGLLADRPPPDDVGRQYLAVDEAGGTLYGATGETWLQLAKGVTA